MSSSEQWTTNMQMLIDLENPDSARLFSEQLQKNSGASGSVVELRGERFCPNRIVPIVALADEYRRGGGEIHLHAEGLPLLNACKGFLSDELSLSGAAENAFGRVWRFENSEQLTCVVDSVLAELDRKVELAKGVKLCFGWCLNEVMDNVLTHSAEEGRTIGYVMVQFVPEERLLKVCVFDIGVGLKASFAGSRHNPGTPEEAIELAVQQNVTSGKGQGNGLYGLRKLVEQSPKGSLHIRSAGAEYLFDPVKGVESSRPGWSFSGYSDGTTLVDFQIVCDGELSFRKAFPGALDLVDLWLESREDDAGSVRLRVLDIVSGCGTRACGAELRTVAVNIIENERKRVILDFKDIDVCSSGFVDELIGGLILKYDFVAFSQFVRIESLNGVSALLVNHSLAQRMAERLKLQQ